MAGCAVRSEQVKEVESCQDMKGFVEKCIDLEVNLLCDREPVELDKD